jgi:hypothetical protein
VAKDASQGKQLPEELSGWDIVLGVIVFVLTTAIAVVFSILTIHFGFELLDYIHQSSHSRNNANSEPDGFERLDESIISIIVFVPFWYGYFRLSRKLLRTLISHINK